MIARAYPLVQIFLGVKVLQKKKDERLLVHIGIEKNKEKKKENIILLYYYFLSSSFLLEFKRFLMDVL